MTVKEYAHALVSLEQQGDAPAHALVDKIIEHLKKTGRVKLLPEILHEMKLLRARSAKTAPQLEVAKEKDIPAAITAAQEAGISVEDATVNPSLLSGWRARSGGKLVDRSGKSALISIYKHVTS